MPTDDKPKRPGTFQGDIERSLAHRRVQTPSYGVPIHTPHPDDFTPVTEILSLADRIPDAESRELIRDIAAKIWQHTANMRMRSDAQYAQSDAAEIEAIRDKLDDHETRIVDISGAKGDNGKLGETRRGLQSLTSKAWGALAGAVGMLVTIAVLLVKVTRAFDAVEARAEHNTDIAVVSNARILALESALLARRHVPAVEPGKETP